MKWKKLAYIYAPIFFVLTLFLLVTIPMNTLSSVYGFGVDSEGNVYIARNMNIDVYNGDKHIENIRLSNGKYSFTVLHDDTLVVAYPSNTYYMDKNGNIEKKIEESPWDRDRTFEKLEKTKNKYTDVYGNEYKYTSILGYYTIQKITEAGNETIYRMPALQLISQIVAILLSFSMVIFVPTILILRYKEEGVPKLPGLKTDLPQ